MKRWRSLAAALVALLGLHGCGRTSTDGPSSTGGESCVPHAGVEEAPAAPVENLPATLQDTLCNVADELWIAFEGGNQDPTRGVFSARLASGSGAGPYTVSLFGVDQGRVQPLPTGFATHVFTLDNASPELIFAQKLHDFSTSTVVLRVQGPAGPVVLELERPELPPIVPCSGRYESLPPLAPARALPTILEAELCNFRDSRTWGIEVAAGRSVSVTLDNPLSIDSFSLSVYRSDVSDYQPLPVTAGTTTAELGLLVERRLTFTPKQTATVYLYAGTGSSRSGPPRLRVEQLPD